MFGHRDDDQSAPADGASQNDLIEGAVNAEVTEADPADRPSGEPAGSPITIPSITADPAQGGTDSTAAPTDTATADTAAAPEPAPAASGDNWQHPGLPSDDSNRPGQSAPQPESAPAPEPEPKIDVISPAGGFPKRPTFSDKSEASNLDDALDELKLKSDAPAVDDSKQELMDIRQKALTELRPIVDKLDLPPDEKFRTIMMIIQISDDEELVKAAYEAAHAITDEKDRAQALLDIVNEVNYFTHTPDQPEI